MEIILQAFSDILDFSSIANDSFLHEAIVECSNLSRAGTVVILKALNLLTRNAIYLFKLEGSGHVTNFLVSPSPKQYRLSFYKNSELFLSSSNKLRSPPGQGEQDAEQKLEIKKKQLLHS